MKKNNNKSVAIENLEARAMFSAAAPHVVGYLPDYEYNQYLIANLNAAHWEGLTQVNYFSVLPDANGVLPGTSVTQADGSVVSNTTTTTSNGDASNPLSNIDAVTAAAHLANVKVDIVIGGAAGFSTELGNVIGSGTQAWDNFAASVGQFCKQHNLDGVDIDWEPDTNGAATPTLIQDYGYLLGTLRQNTSGLTISAAVNAEQITLSDKSQAYVLNAESVQSLDSINVMAYDLGNPADNAPIAKAEQDMQGWASYVNGIAAGSQSKLIFGMPFYGKATTIDPTVANQWPLVTDNNVAEVTYADLVANVPVGSIDFSTADVQQSVQNTVVPGNLGGTAQTWNFDNRGAVYAKTQFALQQQYGGVLAWAIGQDYFDSNGYVQNESLLPAIQQAVTDYNNGAQPTQPSNPTGPTNPNPTNPTPPTTQTGSDTITGTIFNDSNGDGSKGKHEGGLAGWTVYLDLNNDGVYDAGDIATTTNSQGQFTFNNLADGNYIVRVVQKNNYQATTDCALDGDLVTASNDQTTYCGLFGEQLV